MWTQTHSHRNVSCHNKSSSIRILQLTLTLSLMSSPSCLLFVLVCSVNHLFSKGGSAQSSSLHSLPEQSQSSLAAGFQDWKQPDHISQLPHAETQRSPAHSQVRGRGLCLWHHLLLRWQLRKRIRATCGKWVLSLKRTLIHFCFVTCGPNPLLFTVCSPALYSENPTGNQE